MSSRIEQLREFKKRSKEKMARRVVDGPPVIDIYEKATNSKILPNHRTGLVIDDRFATHECAWDSHLENPQRYTCIIDRMNEYGLIARCKLVETRELTVEEAAKVHDVKHVELLKEISENENIEQVEQIASNYDSIYFNKFTYSSAMLAAGSCINLVDRIITGDLQNGMAVVRPPGHHAMQSEFNGFCFLNTVAIAAKHALDNHNVQRILIVDWDVHHGQGIQRAFYNDNRVLYISIHRYEHGHYWPCLRESNFDHIGEGKGTGYNINVPLNQTACDDSDYLFIFNNIVMPVAYEFQPELILVSAGYDAAAGCPEGRMLLTPKCYSYLTNQLMALALGKVAIVLEGGYFPPSLSESAALTLGALLGDAPPPNDVITSIKTSVKSSVLSCIYYLRNHWKCFGHFDVFPSECAVNIPALPSLQVQPLYEPDANFISRPPYPTRNYSVKNTEMENIKYEGYLATLKIGAERYKTFETRVGYCFDLFMLEHYNMEGYSPERPQRLTTTKQVISEFELFERMHFIESESLQFEDLLAVHDPEYVQELRDLEVSSEQELNKDHGWVNMYTSPDSVRVALLAAGCVKKLTDQILNGVLTSAVAIVRPPGHHAEIDSAGGFCFINNVALAARHAIDSKKVERVMILDWDVHHGNGIQEIFFNSRDVLYMSLHRYDHATFYPNSHDSNYTKIGRERGYGFTVNVAWNNERMDNTDYISAFFRVVLPVAYEFNPELIIIAAGFDAAIGDPLGGYDLTPEVFGHFIQLLKPTCGGKILVSLEGGYNCHTVAYCLAMCCKALLGDPMPMLENCNRPKDGTLLSIAETITAQSGYWSSLLCYVHLYTLEDIAPELNPPDNQ